MNPLNSSTTYTIGERLFRTTVFQSAVYNYGKLERFIIWLFNVLSQLTCWPKTFDAERGERGLKAFKSFGADVKFVVPKDGQAKIQMMYLSSEVFERKIQSLGGNWQKLTQPLSLGGKTQFVIVPPLFPSAQWDEFDNDMAKLRWKKQKLDIGFGNIKEVIVTCEDASSIKTSEEHQNLFLNCNSASVSFIMLANRIGFYLGCKQNICFYDPRGTWKSSGVPSEGGYYNDIVAVHTAVKDLQPANKTWVMAACGGVPAAAYLKSKLHGDGTNFIFESGFFNLKEDFIDPEFCLTRKMAAAWWKGLESRDIAPEHKPEETGFNVHQLWKDLKQTDIGKVMIVRVNNDQRIFPPSDVKMMELAKRVNSNVKRIAFDSKDKDPHSDRYHMHSKLASQGLSYIFTE